MSNVFPKRITLCLPALHREGLASIQSLSPRQDAARLIEHLLADSIWRRLAQIPAEEAAPPEEAKDAQGPMKDGAHFTVLVTGEQAERLGSLLHRDSKMDISTLVQMLFEWGLDALSEKLSIVDDGPGAGTASE